jgi:hypothetical protein
MTADITMHAVDMNLQSILWRYSREKAIQCCSLTSITYETASAPYLATKCLKQLAEDEEHLPLASKMTIKDFYVNDILTDTREQASELIEQSTHMLEKGGFPLWIWCSNHPAVLEAVQTDKRQTQCHLCLDNGGKVGTLGLHWQPVCR